MAGCASLYSIAMAVACFSGMMSEMLSRLQIGTLFDLEGINFSICQLADHEVASRLGCTDRFMEPLTWFEVLWPNPAVK